MIYLDNAATTLYKPQCVYDAVMHAMKNYGNSGRGYGETSLEASRCIFETRKCLTEFFGGDNVSGLIFTSNATEALNTVIHGLFNEGDTVITTNLEHNSVLRPLYYAGERGVKADIVSCSGNGIVDASGIEDMITKATKAIEPRPFAKASASFSADMPPIMPTTIIVMIITASIKSKVRLLSPPIRG